MNYPQVAYWRFEVVYSSESEQSMSALNFLTNRPPRNGSCSISPLNGTTITTTTLLTVSCSDWFDEDKIKDYSLYGRGKNDTTLNFLAHYSSLSPGYASDPSPQMLIAFSFVPIFQVRLPSNNQNQTLLHLIIHIRDRLHCVTKYNLSSVAVTQDMLLMDNFVDQALNASDKLTNSPLAQLLSSGDQNLVGQLIISLSQEFNRIHIHDLDHAYSSELIP